MAEFLQTLFHDLAVDRVVFRNQHGKIVGRARFADFGGVRSGTL
jgi:hypothetical protein